MNNTTSSNKCNLYNKRKINLKNRLINNITFKLNISDYYDESKLYMFHFETEVGVFHNNSKILNDVIDNINEAFYDSNLNISTEDIKYSKFNRHGSSYTCFDIKSEIIPKLIKAIDNNKHIYDNLFVYFINNH